MRRKSVTSKAGDNDGQVVPGKIYIQSPKIVDPGDNCKGGTRVRDNVLHSKDINPGTTEEQRETEAFKDIRNRLYDKELEIVDLQNEKRQLQLAVRAATQDRKTQRRVPRQLQFQPNVCPVQLGLPLGPSACPSRAIKEDSVVLAKNGDENEERSTADHQEKLMPESEARRLERLLMETKAALKEQQSANILLEQALQKLTSESIFTSVI